MAWRRPFEIWRGIWEERSGVIWVNWLFAIVCHIPPVFIWSLVLPGWLSYWPLKSTQISGQVNSSFFLKLTITSLPPWCHSLAKSEESYSAVPNVAQAVPEFITRNLFTRENAINTRHPRTSEVFIETRVLINIYQNKRCQDLSSSG